MGTIYGTILHKKRKEKENSRPSNLLLILQPLLPSPFTPSDATQLLNACLKSVHSHSSEVFCDSMVLSDKFIANCRGMFEQLMKDKAEKVYY